MKNKQLIQILLICTILISVATPITLAATTPQASTSVVSITNTPYSSIVIAATDLIMAIICGTAYIMILKGRNKVKSQIK